MGAASEAEASAQLECPKPARALGVRHLQMLMLFSCTLFAYMVRVSVSMAIVAMTSPNDYGYPQFDWSKSLQDTVLSSFFWGYFVLQVPAGLIAARFGSKIPLGLGMFVNGVVCLIAPVASTNYGWIGLSVCRTVMGLAQGLLFPSIHGMLGKWAPDNERSRLGTFVYSGCQLGTVLEMMVAGTLSASPWGWPSVYYSVGALSILWTVAWFIIGANSPSTSRFISNQERDYIHANTGSETSQTKKNLPTPWKKMFGSLGFWSILLAHCGQAFGFWTLLTEMPSYMNYILGVDIKSNGFYSALPYMVMFLLSLLFSWVSDTVCNKNILSKNKTRKLFNTIAHWGPAVMLLGLAYLPAGNLALAIGILTVCVGLNGAHYTGFMMVHIDMAPNYASIMMGITNGASTIFSIMAPLSVSLVIKDETLASEWRNVFYISICFYFLANLFFLLFATTDRQSWNTPDFADDENTDTGKNLKSIEAEKRSKEQV